MNSISFRSKVDGWLLAVLVGGAAVTILGVLAAGRALPWPIAAATLAVGCLLPLWALGSTRYILTDTELLIRVWPFGWRVPIRELASITPTRSALSSPALSLDRLRIAYSGAKAIMVSPADRERFLRELEARRASAKSG